MHTAEGTASRIIVMDAIGDGTINGHHFNSTGSITIDEDSHLIKNEIVVDDIPELGNSLLAASCTSYNASSGGVFAPAVEGAARMIDVMGAPYHVDVRYIHTDDNGKEIARLEQSLDVEQDSERHYRLRPALTGWYDGPTDLTHSPGYAIYLRQGGPGRIEATYGQSIFSASAQEPINAHVRRTYSYHSGGTLPFDQVWRYKLLTVDTSVSEGKRTFTSYVSASMSPAEPSHADVPAEVG